MYPSVHHKNLIEVIDCYTLEQFGYMCIFPILLRRGVNIYIDRSSTYIHIFDQAELTDGSVVEVLKMSLVLI